MQQSSGNRITKGQLTRAAKVGLIVGTILALINHFDMFLNGSFETGRVLQVLLTYIVPFLVSLYSMVTHQKMIERGQ